MKTDGIFTVHAVTIPVNANIPIRLIPFGDIHRDSNLFAEDRWQEFLSYSQSCGKEAYFLGMGDYLDSWSSSEREVLRSGKLHDTTIHNMEKAARKRVEKFADEISFMRGRCLGVIGGNHCPEFRDGTSGDQMLAKALDAKYLGVCSMISVVLQERRSACRTALTVFAHHGKGGSARLAGGSLNTVGYSAEFIDADILLMGHDHKRGILPLPPLLRVESRGHGGPVIKERQRFIGRTGSFLKAYVDGQASYNVDAARGPSALGHIEFEITLKRKRTRGSERVYTSIRGIC